MLTVAIVLTATIVVAAVIRPVMIIGVTIIVIRFCNHGSGRSGLGYYRWREPAEKGGYA